MLYDLTEKDKENIEAAQLAFWEVIAEAYPQAKYGDFSPEGTFAFSAACEEAVSEWIHWNVPCSDYPQVEDEESAKEFIRACVRYIGGGYHPDTKFDDYIDFDTRERLFNDEEAKTMEERANAAHKYLGEKVYDIGLEELKKLEQ